MGILEAARHGKHILLNVTLTERLEIDELCAELRREYAVLVFVGFHGRVHLLYDNSVGGIPGSLSIQSLSHKQTPSGGLFRHSSGRLRNN